MYFQPDIFAVLPRPPPDWPNIVVLGVPALGLIVLVSMVFLFANSFLIRPASPIVIGTIGIRLPALPTVSWTQLLTVLALSTALLRWHSAWVRLRDALLRSQAERDDAISRLAALREQQAADNKQRGAQIARLAKECDLALVLDAKKDTLLAEQAGTIARLQAEKREMEEWVQRNSDAYEARLVKVKRKHWATLAELKEAYEAAVSSLEARLEAAISSQCGSCAAKDQDIEQLRVGMKGVEEQAENDKRMLNAEKDALLRDLVTSRAATSVQQAANEELKDKYAAETASLHTHILTAETNEDSQRARAVAAEVRLEEAAASHASEMEAMSATLDQLRDDLDDAHANSASDKLRLEALEHDVTASRAEVTATGVVNTDLREKLATLQAHASTVEADREAQHARAEAAEVKLDEALTSYQAARNELRISQDENVTLSASIDQLREDVEAAKSDGQVKDAIITSYGARIEALEESDAFNAAVIEEQRVRHDEDIQTIAQRCAEIEALGETIGSLERDAKENEEVHTRERDALEVALVKKEEELKVVKKGRCAEKAQWEARLDEITEELESARQYADSCAVTNEELESALSDRDATIVSLTSKIETTEAALEQLSRLEKESEELRAAHEGHLRMQTELEVATREKDETISYQAMELEEKDCELEVRGERIADLEKAAIAAAAHVCPSLVPAARMSSVLAAEVADHRALVDEIAKLKGKVERRDKRLSRAKADIQKYESDLKLMLMRKDKLLDPEAEAEAKTEVPSGGPNATDALVSSPPPWSPRAKGRFDDSTPPFTESWSPCTPVPFRRSDIPDFISLNGRDESMEDVPASLLLPNIKLSSPPGSTTIRGNILEWSMLPPSTSDAASGFELTESVFGPPRLAPLTSTSPSTLTPIPAPGEAIPYAYTPGWSTLKAMTLGVSWLEDSNATSWTPVPSSSGPMSISELDMSASPSRRGRSSNLEMASPLKISLPCSSTPLPAPHSPHRSLAALSLHSAPMSISEFGMPATPSQPGISSVPPMTLPLKTSLTRPPTPVPASYSPRQSVTAMSPQSPRPPTPPPWAKPHRPTTMRAVQRAGGKENVAMGKVALKGPKTHSGRPPALARASPATAPQPPSTRSSAGKARKRGDPPASAKAKGKGPVKFSSSDEPVPVRGPALRIPLVLAPAPSRSRK